MDDQVTRIVDAITGRLFIELEASGRHVHLTREAALTLFGHPLTPKRPLSQPGQFVCQERVRLVTPKGSIDRVAVLGPERRACQVELRLRYEDTYFSWANTIKNFDGMNQAAEREGLIAA